MNETSVLIAVIAGLLGIGLGLLVASVLARRRAKTPVSNTNANDATRSASEAIDPLVTDILEMDNSRVVLQRFAEWLHIDQGIPLVVVYSFDRATNRLVDPLVVGGELANLPDALRIGTLVYGQVAADVARNRFSPRFVESIPRDLYFGPSLAGAESAYVFPLLHDQKLYGVIGAQAIQKDSLNEAVRAHFDGMGKLIARQLATLHRMADLQHAFARFERFQSLAQQLASRLTSGELLKEITRAARAMLDAQMSILLDVDQDEEMLIPVAWSGISDETAAMMKTSFTGDLKGMVAWAQRPARSADLSTDQRTTLAREVIAAGMVSELAVPVLYFEKLYGVLAVETTTHRNFTDEEMIVLSALAAQAGIALHNVRLYEDVQLTNRRLESTNAELTISRQQAENARAIAVQANRFKTEFINNMSHELRTPLNAVINFTRLIMESFAGPVTDTQLKYLGYVHDSGQHLLGLINDILDLAKIEAGKLELQREPTALEPILRGVMSTAVGLTRSRGIELRAEIAPDLPILNLDAKRIRQVLLNILSNAAKFTLEGHITLRADRFNDQVIIAVQDTGVGMHPEDLSKVFEEFQQIDNPLQGQVAGTGLGMPISRRFIQMHSGEMWIESQIDRGTTVFFSLPIQANALPAAETPVEPGSPAARSSKQ